MKMKLLFVGCLFLSCIQLSFSQDKILEKSSRTPKWINSTQKDYIIESGTGLTVADARNSALMNVKESIIKSVAENIISSSENVTRQQRVDNTYKISGEYKTAIRSKTAELPFIKGISLNKVDEFYWEKVKDKKTGNISFSYYLKYPFSDFELKSIILDFELNQKRLEEELNDISKEIDTMSSIEQVASGIQKLKGLIPELDDQKKGMANSSIANLENILKSIMLTEVYNDNGLISYVLLYGSRHFTTALKPKIGSNCANNFRLITSHDTNKVKYDKGGCFENITNSIFVEYLAGGVSIKGSFSLPKSYKVELLITEGLQLEAIKYDSTSVNEVKLTLPVISRYPYEISVIHITIEFPGLPSLSFDNLNKVNINKGINQIEIISQQTLKRKTFVLYENAGGLVSGSISYFIPQTGESGIFKFYNEKIKTSL